MLVEQAVSQQTLCSMAEEGKQDLDASGPSIGSTSQRVSRKSSVAIFRGLIDRVSRAQWTADADIKVPVSHSTKVGKALSSSGDYLTSALPDLFLHL